MAGLKHSIVIPVYRNEGSIGTLVTQLNDVAAKLSDLEVVFVVDGSPDNSFLKLRETLPTAKFESQLVLLSRNFGAFPAISAGLSVCRGEFIAVIAADLQEPPSLTLEFFRELEAGECDIVVGQRVSRDDPWSSKVMSAVFWGLYRRFVQRELPPGGIDVFGCNRLVRDTLVNLPEANTSLVGLLLWVGFRRKAIQYERLKRQHGRSAWSFGRKVRYLKDSVFAFSDLPIRLLGWVGGLGLFTSVTIGLVVLVLRLAGKIAVPGYTATAILILFFGGLNAMGLSLLGEYLWRNFENTKRRPRFIIFQQHRFEPGASQREKSDG
jgi:glycosyltransferase involved in cell wall biosynthesis